MHIYSHEEKQRLVSAWTEAPHGQKAALARKEGFSPPVLSSYVGRWTKERDQPCARSGCPNFTTVERQFCSNACAGVIHRTADGQSSSTPMRRFLLAKLAMLDITRAELARVVGVSPSTLQGWLKRGRTPGFVAYGRLCEMFPGEVPELLPRDDPESRRVWASKLAKEYSHLNSTPEANRRKSVGHRGLRYDESSGARSRSSKKRIADGRMDWAAVQKASQTPRAIARRALANRLQRHTGQLTRELAEAWAAEVAEAPKVQLTAGAVLDIWRPALRDHGVAFGGQPRRTARYEVVHKEVEQAKKGRSRVPAGFWPDLAARLEIADFDGDGESLRSWYNKQ